MSIKYYVIMGVISLIAIYNILRISEILVFKKGKSKLFENYSNNKYNSKVISFEQWKLNIYAEVVSLLPFIFNEVSRKNHEYIIKRLKIRSKVLNREYTPEEVRGKNFIFVLIAIITIPIGFVISKVLFILPILLLIQFFTYVMRYESKIKDDDNMLDVYFSNLFLLMYPQLRKGSKGRIKNVVLGYQNSLKNLGNSDMTRIMSEFTEFLLSNLIMYQDEIAVSKLTERYKSATILNFSNLASQALQGVNNGDTLVSFRRGIIRKVEENMENTNKKWINRSRIAIYAVFIILIEFIVLSIIAKLPSVAMF